MRKILHGIMFFQVFQLACSIDFPADYKGAIFLCCHGLADKSTWFEKHVQAGTITLPYIAFDFADSIDFADSKKNSTLFEGLASLPFHWWYKLVRGRYAHSSLGQKYDIDQLKSEYDQIRKKWPKAKIILFGISRGAAAIDGLLALYPECIDYLAAIITESEFDSMASVLSNKMKQYRILRIMSKDTAQRLLEFLFSKYDRTAPSPLEYLEKAISQSPQLLKIPRLIVCSETDKLVPIHSTLKLYQKLSKLGHQKVQLIALSEGAHGYLIEGKCREEYQEKIHSFFDKYGLSDHRNDS